MAGALHHVYFYGILCELPKKNFFEHVINDHVRYLCSFLNYSIRNLRIFQNSHIGYTYIG